MEKNSENFVPSLEGAYEALDYLRKTCTYYRKLVDGSNVSPCVACVLRGHGSKTCLFETLYIDNAWDGYVNTWPLIKPDTPPSLLAYID